MEVITLAIYVNNAPKSERWVQLAARRRRSRASARAQRRRCALEVIRPDRRARWRRLAATGFVCVGPLACPTWIQPQTQGKVCPAVDCEAGSDMGGDACRPMSRSQGSLGP